MASRGKIMVQMAIKNAPETVKFPLGNGRMGEKSDCADEVVTENPSPTNDLLLEESTNECGNAVCTSDNTVPTDNTLEYPIQPYVENLTPMDVSSIDESINDYGNMPCCSREAVSGYQSSSTSTSSSSSSCSCSSCSSSSCSEDCDDLIYDKTYVPTNESENDSSEENNEAFSPSLNSTPNTSTVSSFSAMQDVSVMTSPLKRIIKRKRDASRWKRNLLKKFRNSGMPYETHTKNKGIRSERKIKPVCGDKCKLKCFTKFSENERKQIFSEFWRLGDIEKQRQFIANSMLTIQPRYRYIRIGGTRSQRKYSNAFYFQRNSKQVRVCKLFFKNTLDINNRPIRTLLEKKNKVAQLLLEPDLRGEHGKQKTVDPSIKEGIKEHIDSIPCIESHYTRANTSRLFIDESKSIADIHKDYVAKCKEKEVPFANYVMFYRVFTQEYNISFFVPKKDLCDIYTAYENAKDEDKQLLKDQYDKHLIEKDLSRAEKKADKDNCDAAVAVYDLQAVMQLPKGDVSVFYYKSKLNVFNFTIYNLKTNTCDCFVWDEGNGHRGVNELGTCVPQYLRKTCTSDNMEFIFYSDNCAGQQKNKFMIALYMYALRTLMIKSITHKYLIKGHTQNEGDSPHSLIERQVKRHLKSGPLYTPEAFIAAIRSARKTGEPFSVSELCYEDFYDIKTLANDIGPLNMTELKLSEIKVLKVVRGSPTSLFYKNSYSEDFKEATIIRRKKKSSDVSITLTPVFHSRPGISERKKEDLLDLVHKNLIPKYYKTFYNNL